MLVVLSLALPSFLYVGERSTADALPAIIANLQDRGFRLFTVSTLLQ
jgi:hypothetical protein